MLSREMRPPLWAEISRALASISESGRRMAVAEADIVCTVTASPTPILEGRWLRSGTHLNLVGAFTPETREVDTEAIRRSRLFVEIREFALREAGELVIPIDEGAITAGHVVAQS